MYHQESENSYCFSSTGCIQTVSLFGSTCIPEQGLVFHFVDSDNFQLSEARVTITLLLLPFFFSIPAYDSLSQSRHQNQERLVIKRF